MGSLDRPACRYDKGVNIAFGFRTLAAAANRSRYCARRPQVLIVSG